MKIQCDVCSRNAAAVFCCADEAALCAPCDLRVHRANKLAEKHRRLSLSVNSSHPVCDICQEKRGFFFCQQDRAILCRDCDDAIHSANEFTMKHNRFLLIGTSLETVIKNNHETSLVATDPAFSVGGENSSSSCSSSISEYLIKMLPGYRVEDLLEADAVTTAKVSDMMPFMEADPECDGVFGAVGEELSVWDPHVPHTSVQPNCGLKMGRETWSDDSFIVPQINSGNSKRPRTSSAWDF